MRLVAKTELALFCVVFTVTSCRQILGIEPGHSASADGSGGHGSTADGGDEAGVDGSGGTAGGTTGAGGRSGGDGGAGGSRTSAGGGKASGGTGNPQGGNVGAGGTTDGDGGSDAGAGAGGAPAGPLLPDAACAACFARNCGPEKTACEGDPNCVSGVPAWLNCGEPDSGTCTVATPGALRDFETCGSTSCDFCQHLTDGKPSIEILSPSNGAVITVDNTSLVEVTIKVRNFSVKLLGGCAIDDQACGHIHINLDEPNCHSNPFFNTYTGVADADGIADTFANLSFCATPVIGRTVKLRASLSSNSNHADRIPVVESTVNVTLNQ